MVLALVTTEGGSFWVGVGCAVDEGEGMAAALLLLFEFESELGFGPESVSVSDVVPCTLPTLLLIPVNWTDQALGPPPAVC